MNKHTVRTLTSDTLVVNISEILVELKEIRKLVVCSFWRKIRKSRLLHEWACLCTHASGQVLKVVLFSSFNVSIFTLRIVLKEALSGGW